MNTWEYKTLTVPFSKGWGSPTLDPAAFDEQLNVMGSAGWELVSVVTTNQEHGRSGVAYVIFKRSGETVKTA